MWPLSISQSQRLKSPQKTLQISSVSERDFKIKVTYCPHLHAQFSHMYLLFWQRWCGQLRPSLWCPCSSFSWPSSSVTWATSVRSAPSWPSFLESSSSSQVVGNLPSARWKHLVQCFVTLYELYLKFSLS